MVYATDLKTALAGGHGPADADDVEGCAFCAGMRDVVIFHEGRVCALLRRDGDAFAVTRFDNGSLG